MAGLSELKTRVISAFIFLIVILGGIFGGPETFGAVVILISVLLLWEFFGIVIPADAQSKKHLIILWTIAAILPVIWAFIKEYQGESFNLSGFAPTALILIYIPLLFELFSRSADPFANVGSLFLGFFYISIPMALLLDIAFVPAYDPYLILGLFLITWVNDIGAYFVGSLMGKRPLAPAISPNKTWEGSIGGWSMTILMSLLYFHLFLGKDWEFTIILAFIGGVFGSLGDLVESKLKRSAGIKDTGQIMPGHGGILDRLDAFIFFMPFVYLFLRYF